MNTKLVKILDCVYVFSFVIAFGLTAFYAFSEFFGVLEMPRKVEVLFMLYVSAIGLNAVSKGGLK